MPRPRRFAHGGRSPGHGPGHRHINVRRVIDGPGGPTYIQPNARFRRAWAGVERRTLHWISTEVIAMLLHPVDWVIIVVYLIGCIVAGVWMRRYVRGVEDFAVAGREMDVNLGVASLAATEMGLVTVMYTAQLGFTNGPAGAIVGVLMAAGMILVGSTGFVIRPLRDSGVITIPELFEKRFGTDVRWLAGLVVVLGGVLNMGIFLRLGGEFLMYSSGLGTSDKVSVTLFGSTLQLGYLELIMTLLLGIVLLYTVLGGMLSVLVTDYLQFIVMGLGIVVTSVLVLRNIGWGDLLDQLWQAHVGGQALVSVVREAGKPDEVSKLTMNHPFNPFQSNGLGWMYCTWQAAMQLAVVTTWQTMITRVLSAKDSQTAKRVYRGAAFYFVGRFGLPGLWGAAAFVYFLQAGGLPEGVTSLTAMPVYLKTILPIGVIGLLIAAMLAAEMSTDSGYLLTWATVIYNDLIAPVLRRPLSETARLLIVRGLVLAIGLFLLFYGLWYKIPGNAWDYLAVTGNIYLASVFTLLVGALYWRGANRWGAIAAIVLGAIGPFTFLIINGSKEGYLGFNQSHQIPPEVAGFAAFGLAFAGMIFGSLLGKSMGVVAPQSAKRA